MLSNSIIKLPNRLKAVANYIGIGAAVVDVGTDHGLLPVYLAKNGLASHIVASDISEGPLAAARRSANRYNVEDLIEFVVAPGLSGVRGSDIDTVVIAGMGGETIYGILSDALWTKRSDLKIILQPQTKIAELCKWLRENGFSISDTELACESGRFYIIIACKWTDEKEGDSAVPIPCQDAETAQLYPEMELLSILSKKRSPLFPDFIEYLIKRAARIADSMEKSGAAKYPDVLNRLDKLKRIKGDFEKWRP